MVYAALESRGLCAANTFKMWYQKMETPMPRDSRQTWHGQIFGHAASASLDYVACDKYLLDSISFAEIVPTEDLGFPTDH